MAFQPHTLVTFGGTIGVASAGDEIWQCGVRGFADGNNPVIDSDLQALAQQIAHGAAGGGGGLDGIWTDADSKIAASSTLNWVKCANIGGDGKYTTEPKSVQFNGISGPSNSMAPSFCSVAISWTTGLSLGKAVRGRIYLPNFGAELGAFPAPPGQCQGAVIDPSVHANMLVWATDSLLFTLDQSEPNVPHWNPYVVSASGVSHKITGARIGNTYDTQRRRKNAVTEKYLSRAFVP